MRRRPMLAAALVACAAASATAQKADRFLDSCNRNQGRNEQYCEIRNLTLPVMKGMVVDGREILPIAQGQQVTVRQAPVQFGLVKVPGRSYYQVLRDKLHWGTTPNYRTES